MVVDARAAEAAKSVGATRFFWMWLTAATSVSVAGNVAHAVLTAPVGRVLLAAAAAVVPPAVLLGSTHSVALLVRTRRIGAPYWCALAMTFALAACAFTLSFDALRDLAVAVGMPPGRAWLWPVAIDVSIANSTMALLSLTPPRTSQVVTTGCAPTSPAVVTESPKPPAVASISPEESMQAAAMTPVRRRDTPAVEQLDPGRVEPWTSTAEALIRCGVTSKEPALVAAVLAEHAAGTPRSTIGRRLAIHHQTVGRIVAGATELAGCWSADSADRRVKRR